VPGTYQERERAPGPKRLLALDGGGIRGAMSLAILRKIETILREAHPLGEDLVLADYFDFIGGTSTGAIIAAGLALGKPVAELQEMYDELGDRMFKRRLLPLRFWSKFSAEPLTKQLKQTLGEHTTFGDPALRTLLLIVLKNASTDSPWPLSNASGARYNARSRSDCNLEMPLWQLVRASTAAPTFFPAEILRVGEQRFAFVDGGVTTYNNPAFALFLAATLPEYGLGWGTGSSDLLLVSVGTGSDPRTQHRLARQRSLAFNARTLPPGMMQAMVTQQDMLCRVFADTRQGPLLDGELGDMVGERHGLPSKLFTYARHSTDLTAAALSDLGLGHVDARRVAKLDSYRHVAELREIGEAVAARIDPDPLIAFMPT
jgi:predicted acylesterase/phospholipase RssA